MVRVRHTNAFDRPSPQRCGVCLCNNVKRSDVCTFVSMSAMFVFVSSDTSWDLFLRRGSWIHGSLIDRYHLFQIWFLMHVSRAAVLSEVVLTSAPLWPLGRKRPSHTSVSVSCSRSCPLTSAGFRSCGVPPRLILRPSSLATLSICVITALDDPPINSGGPTRSHHCLIHGGATSSRHDATPGKRLTMSCDSTSL